MKTVRNRELTNAQRRLICLHKQSASISNRELSIWATEKFSFPVSEMTVSRTLRKKDQWISRKVLPDGKRARKLICPEVEEATYAWFLAMKDKGAPLTDVLICEAAKRFYANLDHGSATKKQLVFSHGWLGCFKKRHDIKGAIVKRRESPVAESSREQLDQVADVKSVIMDYEPGDVFNMEESGLLFTLEPNKTIATTRITNASLTKERIIVGLTANMDGSIKLPPFVICKYARPYAFISRNIVNPNNLGVCWHSNSLVWMSMPIFETYLRDFERRMQMLGKKRVLLLVESAHSHKLSDVERDLKITSVKFLPNSKCPCPPGDTGIFNFVKGYYRTSLLQYQMDCISSGKDTKIDVYNAVMFLEKAWREHVSSEIISTLFRHACLYQKGPPQLPPVANLNAGAGFWHSRLLSDLGNGLTEITQLLLQVGERSVESGCVPDMTADEYLLYEEYNGLAIAQEPSESDIWEDSLSSEDKEADLGGDVLAIRAEPVTYSDVHVSLQTIATFLHQQQEHVPEMLQKLRDLDGSLAEYCTRLEGQREAAGRLAIAG